MIFQNILTTIGQQKRAIAEAGGTALNITHFKIGDSNGQYYEPIEAQTDLVNVKYTANFTGQSQILVSPTSPNEVLYKCFVPAEIGGFTIRELGLFDSNNDLILICKLPAQDKFALDSGLYQPLTFTPKIIFTNPQTQAVLTVSSQIIATQNFVNQEIENHTNDPQSHTELLSEKVNKDGSSDFTGLQKYATDLTPTDDKHLIPKKYADDIKDSIQHYPLFTSIALDHLLTGSDIVGWALADGNWVDGSVYTDAYNLLLEEYTNGKALTDSVYINASNTQTVTFKKGTRLFKIVDVANISQITSLLTATGTANYYIIDTSTQKFKLPQINSTFRATTDSNKLNDYEYDQIQGHYHQLSTGDYGPGPLGSSGGTCMRKGYGAETANIPIADGTNGIPRVGTETRGKSVKRFLYYKVGNVIANQSLIDVGNLISSMVFKADTDLGNVTEYDARAKVGNRVWISSEVIIGSGQTQTVNHNLGLPNNLMAEGKVFIKCLIPEGGYGVGDLTLFNAYYASGQWGVPTVNLKLNSISVVTSGPPVIFNTARVPFPITNVNWRYLFQINY